MAPMIMKTQAITSMCGLLFFVLLVSWVVFQAEVDGAHDHEDTGDHFDERAVEISEARIMGGESGRGQHREAMADCVEHVRPGEPERERAGGAEPDIGVRYRACGLNDAGRYLGILLRPGRLGTIKRHATDARHGEDCDGQDHDTDTAHEGEL